MDLEEALSGRAGLTGVQWLLCGPQARAVLQHELEGLVTAPGILGPCCIRRAKFRAGRRLSAYYELPLRMADGAPDRPRPLAVTWNFDGDQPPVRPAALLEAEADARGLATPFRRLEARRPEWGLHLQVSPLDPDYPQLIRLLDREHASRLLPGSRCCGVRSIRYRPGQRHVLCYEAPDGGRATAVFAKVYPGAEGGRACERATRLADWLLASRRGIASVKPLADVPAEGIVLYPQAPGVPLSEQFQSRNLPQELYRVGTALRWLHSAPAHLSSALPQRSFQEVAGSTARSGRNLTALSPPAGTALATLLEHALEAYARLPQEPAGFAYGDLKSDHVWIRPEGLTFIDSDSCCVADPAADVGKFLADLHYCYASGGLGGLAREQGWFLSGYAPSYPCLARARVYEAVLLAAIGMRRVALFEADWARRIDWLFARAHRLLNRSPQVKGTHA